MSAPLLCDAQTLADGVSSPKPGPLPPSQVVLWQRTSVSSLSGAHVHGCGAEDPEEHFLKAFLAEEQETGWAVPTGSPRLFPNSGIPREHQERLRGVGTQTD